MSLFKVVTMSSRAVIRMNTFTTFARTAPSVRERCTTRTAASGDTFSACVSSTFCVLLTPETICCTTRRMTNCSAQRRAKAMTMIIATEKIFSR